MDLKSLVQKSMGMLAGALVTVSLQAQMQPAQQKTDLDLGLTFIGQRSFNADTGQSFWLTGGKAELGAAMWHGLGAAFALSGSHATSIGSSGIPISYVVWTAGPRYRWHAGHRWSVYGEALAGEANGFHSLFPAPGAAQSDANGLAVRAGIGMDYAWKKHLAIRVLDAHYLYTQLPNSGSNNQQVLELGAGLVFRFR